MSAPLVEVRNLTRIFGKVRAVDDVSFDISRGKVVGFIGENGAGKTTTMRMMVTLDLPDSGTIRISGFDSVSYPNEVRKRVGWMPDSYGAYDFMDIEEYMDFFARAYGFEGKEREIRVAEVMEFTELNKLADRPVNKLSKGQSQRLCLGRTLLPDPELLVLDEPAAGLDPRARIEVKNLVRILAAEGKTLFISSHILSELEQMCDDLLFISAGKIVHQGSSESLKVKEGHPAVLRIRLNGPLDKLEEWVTFQEGAALVERNKDGLRVRVDDASSERLVHLLRKMVNEGFPVCGFEREDIRLEDAFVDLLNQTEKGVSA
ncbi:MAG: ABC transporter ATP-binding protein [Kiritimatiellia bacterium]